ncbi:MAG: hypothetical protein E6J80_07230, partial [Deltaproteobacteria bacterium]
MATSVASASQQATKVATTRTVAECAESWYPGAEEYLKTSSFPVIIGCLGIVLLAGCSGPEKKAGALVAEASQLVHAAQEAEKTSYSDAFKLYHAALVKAETIATRYPLSQVAAQLAQGAVKIGPYTLTALKNTLVPQTKRKAETEENPLACALVIAKTITDSSRQAGVLEQIALVYIEVGQYPQALQIATMIADSSRQAGVLEQLVLTYLEIGQYPQALQIARTIADSSRQAKV